MEEKLKKVKRVKVINRGSEWRRWDLHVHTKGTNKNDQFTSNTFENFCESLFRKALEKEIAVIGITDYFTIDNYKKVLEFQNSLSNNTKFTETEKQKIGNILLLPNVELRMLPVTDSGKLVNIHCLFNPNYVENLEHDFFNKVMHEGGNNSFAMNQTGFIKIGKDLDSTLSDDDAYIKGIENFAVNIKNLKELFVQNAELKENTIIVVSNSSTDGASGLQEHYKLFENTKNSSLDGTRKAIYSLSDAIFSSNPKDVIFFSGKKEKHDKEVIINKCGSLKVCVHGSDAHTEDKLFLPDNNRNCWIKADSTFDGLKQVLYEPEQRVHIGELSPEKKSGYYVIESVGLEQDKIWNQCIHLNPNLNTIIGGRSTGKSTLLKSIAMKLGHSISDTDFINTLISSVRIIWKDGEESENRDIDYFPQSYMYDIANNQEELDRIVKDILKNRSEGIIIEEFHRFLNNNKNTITTDINSLFVLHERIIFQIQSSKEKGDENGVVKEIEKLEIQIKADNEKNSITEEEQKEYDDNDNLKNEIKQDIEKIRKDIQIFELLRNKEIINNTIALDFASFSDITKENFEQKYGDFENKICVEWKELLDSFTVELEKNKTEKEKKLEEIKNSPCYKKVSNFIEASVHLMELQNRLENERKKLSEIKVLKSEIDSLKKQKKELFNKIIENHSLYVEKAKEVVTKLSLKSEGLEIKSSNVLNKKSIKEFLINRLIQRSYDQQDFVTAFIKKYQENCKNEINIIFEALLDNKIDLRAGASIQNVASELLSQNWFTISHDLIYQKDNFKEMSQGKKAFVILKLLLEFSNKKCPILIDQPEDSLDNRAIYNELVKYLRDKKLERQIILVTHNANIVVNADAEQVIVANQHGKDSKNNNNIKFQYVSGGLENTNPKDVNNEIVLESQGIREHICEILEGGKDAFEEREKKYGFA